MTESGKEDLRRAKQAEDQAEILECRAAIAAAVEARNDTDAHAIHAVAAAAVKPATKLLLGSEAIV